MPLLRWLLSLIPQARKGKKIMDAILFLMMLLVGSKKKGKDLPAPKSDLPAPLPPRPGTPAPLPPAPVETRRSRFVNLWRDRARALLKRGASGQRWIPFMVKYLGSDAAAAAGRWIGIESGGNPLAVSSMGERGLAQIMEKSLVDLKVSRDEWDAMSRPSTSEDTHAKIAAKIMSNEVANASKLLQGMSGIEWGSLAIGKLRHALPLMLRELHDQGMIRDTIPATINVALFSDKPWKPSARLAAFAGGKHAITGDAATDLFLRFMVPASVVALGESAIDLGAGLV